MVDRMKDKDELALEALFSSEPIADDGFSRRVTARVRRRIWLRRLTLPTAMTLGALIAFKPLVQVLTALGGAFSSLPMEQLAVPESMVPSMSTFVIGLFVAAVAAFFVPLLDE